MVVNIFYVGGYFGKLKIVAGLVFFISCTYTLSSACDAYMSAFLKTRRPQSPASVYNDRPEHLKISPGASCVSGFVA